MQKFLAICRTHSRLLQDGQEAPPEEPGSALSIGYPGSMGRFIVARMVREKIPGGFNLDWAARSYLFKTGGLGATRSDESF